MCCVRREQTNKNNKKLLGTSIGYVRSHVYRKLGPHTDARSCPKLGAKTKMVIRWLDALVQVSDASKSYVQVGPSHLKPRCLEDSFATEQTLTPMSSICLQEPSMEEPSTPMSLISLESEEAPFLMSLD